MNQKIREKLNAIIFVGYQDRCGDEIVELVKELEELFKEELNSEYTAGYNMGLADGQGEEDERGSVCT